jgi:spore coat polysaccharide biosynthesis predicted glycosyltransferase SpsG
VSPSQPRVLFICRGSVHDGFGHVIRSRRVATELKDFATTKMVVIGDESAENLLINQDIDYTITPYDQHAMNHFRHFAPDVVVFDLMKFEESHFEAIRQACRTVSLSPIFNCLARVNLMFHRTRIRGKDWPADPSGPVIRCGLEYAIISDHCQKIAEATYRSNLEHETLSVAISMGGGDAANKTLAILTKIKDVPDKVLFWALLGEGYAHSYQDLVHCIRGSKHEIILAKTNDSMWRILNTCSLVILAGGTTTYEAVYAGLPSVNTLETEEHYFLVQELVERGACAYAGYTFEESLCALRGIITRYSRHHQELLKMHENARGLIDGLGARRVAEEIADLCRQPEEPPRESTQIPTVHQRPSPNTWPGGAP